jgi:hypothetical protein
MPLLDIVRSHILALPALAILGPVLTERFAPGMRKETASGESMPSVDKPVAALPR